MLYVYVYYTKVFLKKSKAKLEKIKKKGVFYQTLRYIIFRVNKFSSV